MKKIENLIEEKYKIIVLIILIVGILLRFVAIDKVPIGIHVDEAGMAYDAYCIANYGTDRYDNPNPIYMINYGGGQSSLYTYLAAILIKIFGFSLFIVRMPAFLFSALYIIIAYLITRQFKSKKLAILVEFLIVICPWHFMQSRWGLDCNLMSSLMLLSIYLLLNAKKNIHYILSGISFGITLYSYAISYLIIPVFLILILGYLLYIKKIKIKNIILLGIPIIILAIPLILNLLVNKKIIEPINLGFISMPRLWYYRGREISIKNIPSNLIGLLKTILSYDHNDFNAFKAFGTLYYISIPFCIIGFIKTIKDSIKNIKQKEKSIDIVMIIIFICVYSCLLLFEGQAVYKANSIYISLIYFIAIGIKTITKNIKSLKYGIICFYIIMFIVFEVYYFGGYGKINPNWSFNNDTIEVTQYLEEKYKDKIIYIRTTAIQPYLYTLLGDDISPKEFMNNHTRIAGTIKSYDRYHFLLPKEIKYDIVWVMKIPEFADENLYEELRNENYKEEIYKDQYIIFYK